MMGRVLKAVKHRIEFALIILLEMVLSLPPLSASSALMGCLWRVFAPLTKRHTRALRQLEKHLPEYTLHRREAICRNMWENLGRTFAETLRIEASLQRPALYETDYDEATVRYFKTKGAAVFVSLHMGNWELVTLPGLFQGIEFAAIYKKARNPLFDTRMRTKRSTLIKGGLYPADKNGAWKIFQHLKAGKPVAMMADQRDKNGIEVPFFKAPAPTTKYPATLVRKLNIPLFAACAIRLGKQTRFRIICRHIPVSRTQNQNEDVYKATEAINRQFEAWIHQTPDQWMWAHRRWGLKV